jgi:hypothetical protein
MVNCLGRTSAHSSLEPDLSSAANCGQNPTCSLRIGVRQLAISNAGAKWKLSATDSIKTLILKGIFRAEFFCRPNPRQRSSALFCPPTKILASFDSTNFPPQVEGYSRS